MENTLKGKVIAILVADGFEESEFLQPLKELEKAGASVDIISIKTGRVFSWSNKNWSEGYDIDFSVNDVRSTDYDGLVLPGGVMNPDQLRIDPAAIEFVSGFFDENKCVAAICHGPWVIIETGEAKGRRLTSYPSLKSDLINAGAVWVNEEVVVDRGLITSRSPSDLPAFCKKIVEEFAMLNQLHE